MIKKVPGIKIIVKIFKDRRLTSIKFILLKLSIHNLTKGNTVLLRREVRLHKIFVSEYIIQTYLQESKWHSHFKRPHIASSQQVKCSQPRLLLALMPISKTT